MLKKLGCRIFFRANLKSSPERKYKIMTDFNLNQKVATTLKVAKNNKLKGASN
jgi:hypothetical protein